MRQDVQMLTKIDLTSLDDNSSSKAFLTASAVAPPPTSSCRRAQRQQSRGQGNRIRVSRKRMRMRMRTHEVRRGSTVQVQHVHRGHGQTGTVDQTSNVPVQLDKVEAVLSQRVSSAGLPEP